MRLWGFVFVIESVAKQSSVLDCQPAYAEVPRHTRDAR